MDKTSLVVMKDSTYPFSSGFSQSLTSVR
jgi:hypothetical protein